MFVICSNNNAIGNALDILAPCTEILSKQKIHFIIGTRSICQMCAKRKINNVFHILIFCNTLKQFTLFP